jgi:hypothetical protein
MESSSIERESMSGYSPSEFSFSLKDNMIPAAQVKIIKSETTFERPLLLAEMSLDDRELAGKTLRRKVSCSDHFAPSGHLSSFETRKLLKLPNVSVENAPRFKCFEVGSGPGPKFLDGQARQGELALQDFQYLKSSRNATKTMRLLKNEISKEALKNPKQEKISFLTKVANGDFGVNPSTPKNRKLGFKAEDCASPVHNSLLKKSSEILKCFESPENTDGTANDSICFADSMRGIQTTDGQKKVSCKSPKKVHVKRGGLRSLLRNSNMINNEKTTIRMVTANSMTTGLGCNMIGKADLLAKLQLGELKVFNSNSFAW